MSKGLIATIIVGVLGLGATAAWFFFRGNDEHLRLIPKDAVVVATIELPTIAQRFNDADYKNSSWYKAFEERAQNVGLTGEQIAMRFMLRNPTETGLNVMSDVYYFMAIDGENLYNTLVFDVDDSNEFEKLVKMFDSEITIHLETNYRWGNMDSETVIAWNKEGGIIMNNANYRNRYEDNWSKDALTKVFGRTEENSILANDQFQRLRNTAGELAVYFNGTAASQLQELGSRQFGTIGMFAQLDKMKDVSMFGSLHFNEGDIHFDFEVESNNKEYNESIAVSDKPISVEHIKLMTDERLLGFVSLSFDFGKIIDGILKQEPDAQAEFNEMLASQGLTFDEFKSMFSGEVSLALNTVEYRQPVRFNDIYLEGFEGQPSPEMVPVFTLNFSSGNKEAIKKVLRKNVTKEGVMTEDENGVFHFRSPFAIAFDIAETPIGFMISNNDKLIAKANGQGLNPNAIAQELAGAYPTAAYWNMDISSYSQDFNQFLEDEAGSEMESALTYMKIFKDMKMYGGANKMEFHIYMKDEEENSLATLIKQVDVLYKEENKDKEIPSVESPL
ncbi:MAG: DUF4836 family protein [Flavobacteriales bacterium]